MHCFQIVGAFSIDHSQLVQFSLFVSPQTLQSEHSIYFTKINVARKPKRNQYSLYYLGSPELGGVLALGDRSFRSVLGAGLDVTRPDISLTL